MGLHITILNNHQKTKSIAFHNLSPIFLKNASSRVNLPINDELGYSESIETKYIVNWSRNKREIEIFREQLFSKKLLLQTSSKITAHPKYAEKWKKSMETCRNHMNVEEYHEQSSIMFK
jgi:hypothetical protein